MRRLKLPRPGPSNRSPRAADARAQRKRRERRRQLGRLALRLGLPAVLLAGAGGGAVAAWQSGWVETQADRLRTAAVDGSAEAGLTLQDVIVAGRARTEPDSIVAALGVRRGGPMLAFDPAAAKRRLEDLPWIKHATVERSFPGTVRVDLQERAPMAVWQLDGALSVIDRDGERIDRADPDRWAQLPHVVGPGAPEHAQDLIEILASQPSLNARVESAIRVRDRRWSVRLRNGVEVQLPAETPERAWARLAEIEARHGVLQRDVRMIDLRLPDRMIVRMAPGSKPMSDPPGMGEST
jgi:cell division protein FtsQ